MVLLVVQRVTSVVPVLRPVREWPYVDGEGCVAGLGPVGSGLLL